MQVSRGVDPKAVGSHLAHRPLTRRRSNNCDNLLNSAESVTLLNKTLNQHQLTVGVADAGRKTHRKLDRSQSEPVAAEQQRANHLAASGGSNGSSRYKTELCRPYEENGTCKYGDKCQFAHGYNELRSLVRHPKYKTELCKTFHSIGFCPYGPRCHFIHNAEEARGHVTGAAGSQSSAGRLRHVKLSLPLAVGGSTAESPSPPSSLSQSPTLSGGFFGDDIFAPAGNPFSPVTSSVTSSSSGAFLFGSDYNSTLFAPLTGRSLTSRDDALAAQFGGFQPQRRMYGDLCSDAYHVTLMTSSSSSPSPVDSLASDLDSLSMTSNSPPPPAAAALSSLAPGADSTSSRLLRLPIFSRISETTNED